MMLVEFSGSPRRVVWSALWRPSPSFTVLAGRTGEARTPSSPESGRCSRKWLAICFRAVG